MKLPESPRVMYDQKTLANVLAQVRFPTILKIESKPPADFQERIRKDFPLLSSDDVPLIPSMPRQIQQILKAAAADRNRPSKFCSENKEWETVLSKDYLAFATTDYTRWEDFRNRLNGPFSALKETYEPAFFSRVGLRYRNIVQPKVLGLPDRKWGQLLNPTIAGLLAEAESSVSEYATTTVFGLDDNAGKVRLAVSLVFSVDKHEPAVLIDADLFSEERTEVNDAISRLDSLNVNAGRLFRWCISAELHEHLRPHAMD